jgi:TolB protein
MLCWRQCWSWLWLFLVLPLSVAGLSGSARAERYELDLTNPNFQRIAIAIPDFKYLSSEQTQLARDMGETLANDLDFSGIFRPLDPRGFLENPQTMGLNAQEIKFNDWRRLGADYLVRANYQVQGSAVKIEARLFDVAAGRMVIAKAYEGDARGWRAMVHRFADEILYALTGERGVFDSKIAYVQSVGKNKEIFICDFDGNNPVQATRDNSLDLSPAWNQQMSQIAYVSYREGNAKIYLLNLQDGSTRLLCGYPGLNISPAWRPGRPELAVTLTKDGNPDIYLISSSSGQIIQKLVQGHAINVSPDWSPDGRSLAYVSDESGNPQVYVVDAGGGSRKRITYSGTYNTSPVWSPKGDFIAYSGTVGGRHHIFVVKPDGSGNRQLTNGDGDDVSPTWSPDGRMIAFSSTRQGGSAIWVSSLSGTGVRRLTRQGGGQELPDWSPRMGGGR